MTSLGKLLSVRSVRRAAVNLLIVVSVLTVVDIVFGHHHISNSYLSPGSATCNVSLTNYDYCKGIVAIRYMHPNDRMFPVLDYIGDDRRPTYPDTRSFERSFDHRVYLLGNSFIQAEEMPIQERMGHWLRLAGFEVYEFGYSSWNPFQYDRILKTVALNESDRVFVLMTGNDFTPHYGRSTVNTRAMFEEDEDQKTISGWQRIAERSFLYQRVFGYYEAVRKGLPQYNQDIPYVSRNHDITNADDCTTMPPKGTVTSATRYYVMMSKSKKCWDGVTHLGHDLETSFDVVVRYLRSITTTAKRAGVTVDFLMAPTGWEFVGESTAGRAHPYWKIDASIVITTDALIEALRDEGFRVHSLRKVLIGHNDEIDNDLYFAVDGHWKPKAHRIVSDYLREELIDPGDSSLW